MQISMHRASVPVFTRALTQLIGVLEKAAAYAEERKFDPKGLVNYRLAPDMYPLSRQIQIASDMTKGCVARLAGQEPPKWEDSEATLPELIARLQKTVDFIGGFKAAQIDGTEDKDIMLMRQGKETHFQGLVYLLDYAKPNIYFHLTTAYAILRHAGVPLGKPDYLGKF